MRSSRPSAPAAWDRAAAFGTDLAPDGKRIAVVIPEASTQAPQQGREIVMLLNFIDELRRRVPLGNRK